MKSTAINQSQQKLFNYLEDFIDSNYFQNWIVKTRIEYSIPSDGYSLSKEIELNLIKKSAYYDYMYLPPELQNQGRNVLKELNLGIKELCKKISIYGIDIGFFLRIYLIHNRKVFDLLRGGLDEANLCRIDDFYELLDEYGFGLPNNHMINSIKNQFEYYPIILKLHPSITQRDLLSYIKDNWHFIEYYLSQYKDSESRLGRIKNKNTKIKDRNDFIYKNRNLPRKKIMEMLLNKFGETIDYGHIGKIISLENKRRTKV